MVVEVMMMLTMSTMVQESSVNGRMLNVMLHDIVPAYCRCTATSCPAIALPIISLIICAKSFPITVCLKVAYQQLSTTIITIVVSH